MLQCSLGSGVYGAVEGMRPNRATDVGGGGPAAEQSFNDRIEMLDWSDPERAAESSTTPRLAKGRASEIQFLEIRGMVLVDIRRDADADATMARLKEIADVGDQSAVLAEHYVRAYSLYQHGQYLQPRASSSVTSTRRRSARTRKPIASSIFRGNTLAHAWGRPRPPCRFSRRRSDLARDMHDDQRSPACHALAGAHLHEYRQF